MSNIRGPFLSRNNVSIKSLGNEHKALALALCQLPCFSSLTVTNIRLIESGLSQPCFEVGTVNQRYFAKYIADNYAEFAASELASGYGMSPKVVYAGNKWLITEFIEAQSLQQADLATNKKIALILDLLMQCHQIDLDLVQVNSLMANVKSRAAGDLLSPLKAQQVEISSLPVLNIAAVISDLLQQLNPNHFQHQQIALFSEHLQQKLSRLVAQQATDIKKVLCHGDANFSNVLVTNNGGLSKNSFHGVLIDFECACLAPAEYDLAMMMAVNRIQANEVQEICQQYLLHLAWLKNQNTSSTSDETANKKQINPVSLSIDLVTCYRELSILINFLWYFVEYQARKQLDYKNLAIEQLQLLAHGYPELHNLVLEMR